MAGPSANIISDKAGVSSLSITQFPNASDVLPEIHKAAGRVMFYLSASNCPVILNKIRSRLQAISSSSEKYDGNIAIGTGNNTTEGGDLTELRFIEWCNLNRSRLEIVLGGICLYSRSNKHFNTYFFK